jgi:hypothetical protein
MLFVGWMGKLKPADRTPARNWIMRWKVKGAQDWIPWDDFVQMPEEAFDHFPPGPKNKEHHTYIKTTYCPAEYANCYHDVDITVIRQREHKHRHLNTPRLYKLWAMTPLPRNNQPRLSSLRDSAFADSFNEAMLKAVRMAKGLE